MTMEKNKKPSKGNNWIDWQLISDMTYVELFKDHCKQLIALTLSFLFFGLISSALEFLVQLDLRKNPFDPFLSLLS